MIVTNSAVPGARLPGRHDVACAASAGPRSSTPLAPDDITAW
jgi:hypothetical protein